MLVKTLRIVSFNIFYALRLALKRINIAEIVSTYTELTFIIDQTDLQEAFLALNEFFTKEKTG